MRHFLIAGCLCLLTLSAVSQERPKQNIHSQRIISSYEIVDGKGTGKYFTVTQYLLDSIGRCHTEVDFDRAPSIIAYRWNTYNGKNKVKVESFVADKKVEVDSFVFGNNNSILKQIVTFPNDAKRLAFTEKFTYNPQGRVVRIDAATLKGRRAFRSSYTYDDHGTEIRRKVKVKGGFPLDSIVALNRVATYDSLGRIVREVVTKKLIDNRSLSSAATYGYNAKGNIAEKQLFDTKGALISRVEFLYRSDSSIWQKKTYDAKGVLVEWLAWRLENIVSGPQGRIAVPAQ